jgi:drug/metabolite transporter (DMT)-like permease
MKINQNTWGVAFGVISAICVTGYLTVNKYIYGHFAIGPLEYSMFFAIIGGLFGLISLLKGFNRETYQEIRLNLGPLVVLGAAVFLAVGILIFGLRYTSATNAALLVTTSIVATPIFSYFLLKERLNKKQWVWMIALFFGLYIAIVGVHAFSPRIGDVIVLSSVLFFGFGNAYSRVVMKRMKRPGIVPDVRIVIGAMLAMATGMVVIRNYSMLVEILPFALLAGFFYWLCIKTFAASVHLINANEAVVLNNSHIFFTSIIGVLILGEHYTIEKFVGSVIVIISVYFIAARKKQIL